MIWKFRATTYLKCSQPSCAEQEGGPKQGSTVEQAHACVFVCACMCECDIYIYIYVCVCVSVCVSVCV